ncbi:hypothetical protein CAPTEDRAFT_214961, partial [Capitella teleta]
MDNREIDHLPNKSLRWAAYRQFTWWIHGMLGVRLMRSIPALTKIGHSFPEANKGPMFLRNHSWEPFEREDIPLDKQDPEVKEKIALMTNTQEMFTDKIQHISEWHKM